MLLLHSFNVEHTYMYIILFCHFPTNTERDWTVVMHMFLLTLNVTHALFYPCTGISRVWREISQWKPATHSCVRSRFSKCVYVSLSPYLSFDESRTIQSRVVFRNAVLFSLTPHLPECIVAAFYNMASSEVTVIFGSVGFSALPSVSTRSFPIVNNLRVFGHCFRLQLLARG